MEEYGTHYCFETIRFDFMKKMRPNISAFFGILAVVASLY